jgi:hypothetical protein
MVYHSKKDISLMIIIWIAILVPTVAGIIEIASRRLLASGLFLLMMEVFIVSLLYPLQYEITRSMLLVRSGIVRWEVPLADIMAIVPVRNFRSSPAWSRDRLLIAYRRRNKLVPLLISPERRQEFLQELITKSPGLEPEGNGYARSGAADYIPT